VNGNYLLRAQGVCLSYSPSTYIFLTFFFFCFCAPSQGDRPGYLFSLFPYVVGSPYFFLSLYSCDAPPFFLFPRLSFEDNVLSLGTPRPFPFSISPVLHSSFSHPGSHGPLHQPHSARPTLFFPFFFLPPKPTQRKSLKDLHPSSAVFFPASVPRDSPFPTDPPSAIIFFLFFSPVRPGWYFFFPQSQIPLAFLKDSYPSNRLCSPLPSLLTYLWPPPP